MPTFDDVRRIALALPEAEESLTWETDITFRVRDKIFAIGGEGADRRLDQGQPRDPGRAASRWIRGRSRSRPTSGGSAGSRSTSTGSIPPCSTSLLRDAWRRTAPKKPRRDAGGLHVTTPDETLPEHVRRNRAAWDEWAPGVRRATASAAGGSAPGDEKWGVWDIPERERPPPARTISTARTRSSWAAAPAYVSAWLARRGARPVGIDNSEQQLATARRLQAEHGIDFPLIHGNAERVPYPDASFDLAISEYGASIWADPYALDPGGVAAPPARRPARSS